ncbi:MAG: hypothetical protein H0W58_06695 [Acidobacteria bacterium]|jgi:hypothetical protein|nr:hypothetical protein [Acidobacteriota bacterium]
MTLDSNEKRLDFSGETEEKNTGFAPIYSERDSEDVLTISNLLRVLFILTMMLLVSCGVNFYLALRKADLIVVDKTSGRTLAINNKDYGQTEAVSLTLDNLTSGDKKALVTEFLHCLYEVNGATRPANVNRLLKMMEPNLSLQQAQLFNTEKLLAQEKAESVNSSWQLQDLSVDERDPYIVRALGKRIIRRVQNGVSLEEETQIKVKFLLMDSPTNPMRNENNYRTGYYILKYRAEAVDGTRKSPLVLLSDERTAGG